MSKRASVKHSPVTSLDALEERTLLSPVPIASTLSPRAVLVEPVQPVDGFGGAQQGTAPSQPSGSLAVGYGDDVVDQAMALPVVPTGTAVAAPARAATALPVTMLVVTEYAAPVRHVDVARALDGAFFALSVPSGPLSELGSIYFATRAAHEAVSLPAPFHAAVPWPSTLPHGMTDANVDDRLEMSREGLDGEETIYQPVARADGSTPALLALRASSAAPEEHALRNLPPGVAVPAGAAVGQRVDSAGHDLLPSPQGDTPVSWPVLRASDIPDVSLDGLSAIAVDAARAAGSAVGSVVIEVATPEHGAQAPARLATPAPEGIGLIAEVLPFDGDTVAAAIDRFFDRFDDPSADEPDGVEPAGLTLPPGTVLIAVATVELARRRWQQRREQQAAFGARRRGAEGPQSDNSFGSCGPWSSRLS